MKPTLPTGWRWVALGALLSRHKDLVNPSDEPDRQFNSVGLEDIGGDGSGTIHVQQVNGTDLASSKARFAKGDLLYGRMRPYLNKIAIAPSDGVCSTEIWVHHPKDVIETEYAFWILTSRYFLQRVERVTEGANLPRADADGFDRIDIPVPPLSEQRRIVEILNEARDIRRLRQQADDLTAKLIPAIFDGMFGDPIGQTPAAQRTPVSEFVRQMKGGKSLSEDPSGSQHRVIKVSAVTWGKFQSDESKFVSDSYEPPEEHRVMAGDLLFSRANTYELVGATVLVEEDHPDVLLSDKIWRFLWKHPDEVDPHYMLAMFQHPSMRREISNNATGTGGSMKNISKGKLMKIRVQLAPYEDQTRFGDVVRDITSLYLNESDDRNLMRSFLAHAFSGELTSDWREANRELLDQEAAERDEWLREAGVKLSVANTKIEFKTKDQDDRHANLNREQYELLSQIQSLELDDSAGTFSLSTLTDSLVEPLDKLPVATVRRHLDVLAARGLVKSLSRRAGAGGSVDVAFGNAYRLPRNDKEAAEANSESDEARMAELDRLSRQGRVFHETVTSTLNPSGNADVSVTENEGDE